MIASPAIIDVLGHDPASPCDVQRPSRETVASAVERVLTLVQPVPDTVCVPLDEAAGRVLREPLLSRSSLPVFDQAAVDGYALALQTCEVGSSYKVVGRVAAGSATVLRLRTGEAARIFTGAPIPAGTDAIVMQENVSVETGEIALTAPVSLGANIRRRGEDVLLGTPILHAEQPLDSRHVALAAAVGHQTCVVSRPVRVALMSTGSELSSMGRVLEPGRVHDSNRPMLMALLRSPGIEITDLGILPDDPLLLRQACRAGARDADILITSGGASVGEEDHVGRAVLDAGGHLDLLTLPVKPGKPVKVGRLGSAMILALPGNPLAAYVTCLLLGRPMLDALSGARPRPMRTSSGRAGFSESRKSGRLEFAPVCIVGSDTSGLPVLERTGKAGAARLAPLAAADGLCVIGPEIAHIGIGDLLAFLTFEPRFT